MNEKHDEVEEEIESLWENLDELIDNYNIDEDEWEEMEDEEDLDEDDEPFDQDLLQRVIETQRKKQEVLGEAEREEEFKSKGLDSIIFDPKDLYLPD